MVTDYSVNSTDKDVCTNNPIDKKENITQCVGGENNAMRGDVKNWKIGVCLHCSKEFEKRTTWMIYCSDICRQTAYTTRTGKKLHRTITKSKKVL